MCLTHPIIMFLLSLSLLCSARATAQIRIVDEQDGKPIAGAYTFSSDNAKYRTSTNPMLKVHTNICDWTYSSKAETWSTLLSFRSVYNYDYQPLPKKKFIAAEEMRDFVVSDVKTLNKEQADRELKDKTETADFTLPDCLPAIPYDMAKETQGMKKTKFWEM